MQLVITFVPYAGGGRGTSTGSGPTNGVRSVGSAAVCGPRFQESPDWTESGNPTVSHPWTHFRTTATPVSLLGLSYRTRRRLGSLAGLRAAEVGAQMRRHGADVALLRPQAVLSWRRPPVM